MELYRTILNENINELIKINLNNIFKYKTNKRYLVDLNFIKTNSKISGKIKDTYFKINYGRFKENCFYLIISKKFTTIFKIDQFKLISTPYIVYCPIYIYYNDSIPITLSINTNFKVIEIDPYEFYKNTFYQKYLFGKYSMKYSRKSIIMKFKHSKLTIYQTKSFNLDTVVKQTINNYRFKLTKNLKLKRSVDYFDIYSVNEFNKNITLDTTNILLFNNYTYYIKYNLITRISEDFSGYYEREMIHLNGSFNYMSIELYYGFLNKKTSKLVDEIKNLDIISKYELWDLKNKYDGIITKNTNNNWNKIKFILNYKLNNIE